MRMRVNMRKFGVNRDVGGRNKMQMSEVEKSICT